MANATISFERGDRVKLWGKSKDAGIVDRVWLDGRSLMVAVVWEGDGRTSDEKAYRLQFAALPPTAAT